MDKKIVEAREVRKSVNINRLLEEIFKSIDAEYERIKQDSQNYNEFYERCVRAWKVITYREPEIGKKCAKRFTELFMEDMKKVKIEKERR